MKKIVSFGIIAMLTSAGFAAAPSHITRNSDGGYDVTYDYKDKAKTGWYAGARAELNFMNWEYKFTDAEGSDSDKFSFEPLFGGSAFFGKRIEYFWRAELEAGFLGYHSENDNGAEMKLSLPYAMINGYRDFNNGLYLGAGVGAALPISTISQHDNYTTVDETTKTSFSPMAGVMLGYSHKLDDNLVLDLRYRFAGIMGMKNNITIYDNFDPTDREKVEVKTNFFMDNSISVGLRYEF